MKYEEAIAEAERKLIAARRNVSTATDDAEKGYQTYEELKAKMEEVIKRGNEVLGIPEVKTPEGTVGIYNPETKKWEGGMSEEEVKKGNPHSTVGVYHQETKTWVGGGSKTDQKHNNPKVRGIIKNLAKRENHKG